MSIIEQTKIGSHLASKCKVRKLHYNYTVTDGILLEVSIWRESGKGKTIMSSSVSLDEPNAVKIMLLKINEALAEEKLENIFS